MYSYEAENNEMTVESVKANRPRKVADQSSKPMPKLENAMTYSQDMLAPTNETPSKASNSGSLEAIAPV